ncbi:hypothetical protein M413DRAFT_29737 [Hebeloma cylindrosporum]|uniref:Uncharacterized protein n=1 Tax=Hebeloma cylindrosporum TaxID=76867 RepID=A0A0C3C3D3_HEBCY|nr:hypothetical protein M413DRAFT_29737 [Hebeloma cylindrosporum h7]
MKVKPIPHAMPKAMPKLTALNPIQQTRIPTAEMERMLMADKPPAHLERRLASLEEEMDAEEEPHSSRAGLKRKRTPEDDEDYMQEDEGEGEYEEERQMKMKIKMKKKGWEADVSKQQKARPTGKMKVKCCHGNNNEGKLRKQRNAPVPDSDNEKMTKMKESRRAKAQYTSSDREDEVPKDVVLKDAAASAIKHRREKGCATDLYIAQVHNTAAHIQNTEYKNLDTELVQALSDMQDLGMRTLFANEFIKDIAIMLKYANCFSCNASVRCEAVEVFGSLLTSEQRHKLLSMDLFPAFVDPGVAVDDPDVPPVARGENFCVMDMITMGSVNYEALKERLESTIKMAQLLMGIKEGKDELEKGKSKDEAIEIDE